MMAGRNSKIIMPSQSIQLIVPEKQVIELDPSKASLAAQSKTSSKKVPQIKS
jgi:hypothetical protein